MIRPWSTGLLSPGTAGAVRGITIVAERLPIRKYLSVGLVPVAAAVRPPADNVCPGLKGAAVCAWRGDHSVYWNLPCAPSGAGLVSFGQGDTILLILDCRAAPMVRILVNDKPCIAHVFSMPSRVPLSPLYPAVALLGSATLPDDGQVRVSVRQWEPRGSGGWDADPLLYDTLNL